MKNFLKILLVLVLPIIVASSTLGSHLINLPHTSNASVNKEESLEPEHLIGVTSLGRLEPLGEIIEVAVPAAAANERIGELFIKDGDTVKNGQVVAVMESSNQIKAEYKEALERISVAIAQLKKVKAGAKAGELLAQKSQIERLKLELEGKDRECLEIVERSRAQVAFDENEYKRFSALVSQGAVTVSQFESKRLALESSKCRHCEAIAERERINKTLLAQIDEAKATYEKIAEIRPCDIAYAEAEVLAARAHAEKMRQQYELTLVRAPMDGQVIKVITKKGEAASNKTLFELGKTNSMVAVAEVFESDVHKIKIGDNATISGSAILSPVSGKVIEIGHKLIKQKVFSSQPGENFDDRVVETKILIDKACNQQVKNLTNAQVQILFEERKEIKEGTKS
ncbi:MAG: efflux RND transporter periplasmic adaptor subunit [Cyanobacteria bacterium TGS_CYA1]|nr:efflux RND transporter periplasmic adaptor subunit [Cyanobacteria bacterium TGS_CYA1]